MDDPALVALVAHLKLTLSPDPAHRRPAEQALEAQEGQGGYPLLLLKLVDSSAVDLSVRTAAAVTFKNFIRRRWLTEEGEASRIHDSDRAAVKQFIVDLMLRSPEIVLKQLSEAVSIIGKSDFPSKWPELIPYMTTKFQSGDFHVINGVLRTASSLFTKYKHEFPSNELFTEIKYVLENFAPPLTELFVATISLAGQHAGDASSMKILASSLILMSEIFYLLNYQDLPEFFEDHMGTWMPKFLDLLQFQNSHLISTDEDDPGLLETLRTEICENVALYATKYREEFEPYLSRFVQTIWGLLTTTGLQRRYDLLVSQAIEFLASVARQGHNKRLFEDPNTLGSICENVILPNMKFRESDLEIFEDSPEEYIQRDIEGSDVATRRRAACDLVKALAIHFEEKITLVFSGYIKAMLDAYSSMPSKEWGQKDTAIYLATSLAVKAQTAKHGATQVNSLVNINSFYQDQILGDLRSSDVNSLPVVKADCLRYLIVFRSLLQPPLVQESLPLLPKFLAAESIVTRSYAASLIEKILLLRGDDGQGVVKVDQLLPHAETILTALFQVLNKKGSEENEHAMKGILRCLITLGDRCVPLLAHLLPILTQKVATVAGNPRQPHFNHALFETLGFSVRLVCRTSAQAICTFEEVLFPTFQQILTQDVQDFVPYVFQVLSLLIEFRSLHSLPLPQPYKALFPILLTPILWDRPGFQPPLVRLLQAYIVIAKDEVRAMDPSYSTVILGIVQRLVHSKTRDQDGLALLRTMISSFSDAFWAEYEQQIFIMLFQRLSSNRTIKYSKSLIVFFCQFLIAKTSARFLQRVDAIQPKMFAMVLQNLFCQDIPKMATPMEEKMALVGSSHILELIVNSPDYSPLWNLLLRTVSDKACDTYGNVMPFFKKNKPSAYPGGEVWGKDEVCPIQVVRPPLLDAVLNLFEKGTERKTEEEQEQFVEVEMPEGYQAAYSRLIFARKDEEDPLKEILEPRVYLLRQLQAMCARAAPGAVPSLVRKLSPTGSNILQKYLQANHIALM